MYKVSSLKIQKLINEPKFLFLEFIAEFSLFQVNLYRKNVAIQWFYHLVLAIWSFIENE